MQDNFEKFIEDGIKLLPQNIGQAISSTPWKETLKSISSNHNLSDKENELIAETAVIILGYESPDKFVENLVNNVEINFETASLVSNEIYEKILKPIDEKVGVVSGTQPANMEATPSKESTPANLHTDTPKTSVNVPDYSSYESGKDPYREPIE